MQLHRGGKATRFGEQKSGWSALDKSVPWRRSEGKIQEGRSCKSSPCLLFRWYKERKTKKTRKHERLTGVLQTLTAYLQSSKYLSHWEYPRASFSGPLTSQHPCSRTCRSSLFLMVPSLNSPLPTGSWDSLSANTTFTFFFFQRFTYTYMFWLCPPCLDPWAPSPPHHWGLNLPTSVHRRQCFSKHGASV